MAEEATMKKTWLRNVWEQMRFLFFAILIAVLLRSLLYEPFRIPSESMLPTLLAGDYVFVSKFSYGYSSHSFPFEIVPIKGRIFGTGPERGDVAVFKNPITPSVIYIKRIVGLPGDQLQVIDGRLWINGEELKRDPLADFQGSSQYSETLPNEYQHLILEQDGDNGWADNTRIFKVPEGHYFGMGDNRDNSQDSRFQSVVGFIPEENFIGRAEVTWLSLGDDFWPFSIRFNRFMKKIR